MLTHKYAEANGIRLHYVTTGKGKLLLFVHGFPEFWQGFFTDEDRKAYLAAWSQPGALTGGLNYYRAARFGPPTGDEQEAPGLDGALSMVVEVPTLVIWGEKDTALLTGNLEGLDMFVPDLTIKRIPEGTHWVIHEQPALINTPIREFIAYPA